MRRPGLPFDSLGTMAAGTAPGASCGGGPHSPPTQGLTAGGPVPVPALEAPAPAGRAVPRRYISFIVTNIWCGTRVPKLLRMIGRLAPDNLSFPREFP